jgi:DUF177 domain-containing protein
LDAGFNTIDLARQVPAPGDGRRLEVTVTPDAMELGGQAYGVAGGAVPARLDLSRTSTGYAIRLRFEAHVDGPCMRCLADADVPVQVDAREVDQADAGDEELRSPYVDGDELDLGTWARDALALALPGQLVCRPDCLGLCPVCGASLNDADPADHRHEEDGDPRWTKLRELRLE